MQYGVAQAEAYAQTWQRAVALLAENPSLAPLHTEYDPPVRIYPVGKHVLVYLVQPASLRILRFLRQETDLTRHVSPG